MESGNELVELLWQNGQVIFHSQAHKNPRSTPNESRKVQSPVQSILNGGKSCGNLNCSAQGDETASWIQCPLEDSLEELCSEFFFEVPSSDPVEVTGQIKQFEEGKCIQSGASKATTVFSNSTALPSQTPIAKQPNNANFTENQMPLHQSINPDALQRNFCFGKAKRSENFCNFTRPLQAELVSADGSAGEAVLSNTIRSEVAESSMMTLGSSHCRSNQGPTETDFSWVSSNSVGANEFFGRPIANDVHKMFPPCEREQTYSLEPNLTSSSGGSGGTSGKTFKDSNAINKNKRKGRNKDESEPEIGSAEASKSAQRPGSARRRRAAEVHNLSERRRRDRINEKMKALQELIPHCNKTDKASMLDEAIEYLKSLQLQVQIMWIRSGMASATFPSVQHCISQMGIGMGMAPSSIPYIHNPLHFPGVQLFDQAMSMAPASNHPAICSNPVSNPVNFQTQMQSTNFFKPYAHCMGFHHMQTAPQPMNRFNFGSQTIQETTTLPTSSNGHCSRGTPTSDPTSKMG